jgi:malic enzyme
MFVRAAYAIASCVDDPTSESIIPDPFDLRVSKIVAKSMCNEC